MSNHRHLLHAKTVRELQEEVLSTLSDGGFADKRTELEAWCDAAHAARKQKACLDAAYDMLDEAQRATARAATPGKER